MSKLSFLGLLLGLLIGTVPAAGETSPRLALPEIPGFIDPDGQGVYQMVLRSAAQRAKLSFTAEVLPRARALAFFLAGSADGVFTFTQTARERLGAQAVLASYPVGAYRGYAFVAAGRPPIRDFSTLAGETVGGVVGFEGTYTAILEAGATLELVVADAQNLAKLKAGRLDVVLGFLPDLYDHLPQLAFDPTRPFFEAYDRLTLHNTPENREWLMRLSASLEQMHSSGEMRSIVGPAYLPVSGSFPLDR